MVDSRQRRVTVWLRSIQGLSRDLFFELRDDDVTGLASQVAFNMIFAIPPFIIFLVTVAATINKVVGIPIAANLEQVIQSDVPGDARALMIDIVRETVTRVDAQTISIGAILSLLLAIWGGGRGIGSLIEAFNRAYDVPNRRPFFRQQLLRVALTLLVTVLIVVAFLLFLFGQHIGDWLAAWVGLGATFNLVWALLHWPASVLLILFVLDILYAYGPCCTPHHFQLFTPGALVATALWVLSVFGFKLYLALSDPGTAYGAAGSLVVLLLFLYVTALVFILGAELNAVLAHRRGLASATAALTTPPEPSPPVRRVSRRSRLVLPAVVTAGASTFAALAATLRHRRRSHS